MIGHVLRPIRASASFANWIYLAVGAAVVSVLQPFSRADLVAVANWMNSSIPVPRWLFGLCLTVGTVMGLIGMLASRVRSDEGPEDPPHHKYVHDEIHGVRWRWGWVVDSPVPRVDIDTLVSSCSVCDTKLDVVRSYSEGVHQIALHCGSCEETRYQLPLGTRVFDAFLDEVKREVESRARARATS